MILVSERDHSENDCLFVCIMTHGRENGTIFAYDDEFATSELWENFTEENCPSLVGKPKLFFIQACRGSMTDHGVVESIIHEKKIDQKLLRQGVFLYQLPQRKVSPDLFSMADIFKMHSTAEGHYSFRNKTEGTWFIQALCEELRENIFEDLMTICTNINRRVAYSKQSNVPDDRKLDASKQMPCIDSHLTKKFYFVKKVSKAKVQVV